MTEGKWQGFTVALFHLGLPIRNGVLDRQPSQVETPFLILRRLLGKRLLRGLRVPLNRFAGTTGPELIPGYHPLTVQPQAMLQGRPFDAPDACSGQAITSPSLHLACNLPIESRTSPELCTASWHRCGTVSDFY